MSLTLIQYLMIFRVKIPKVGIADVFCIYLESANIDTPHLTAIRCLKGDASHRLHSIKNKQKCCSGWFILTFLIA